MGFSASPPATQAKDVTFAMTLWTNTRPRWSSMTSTSSRFNPSPKSVPFDYQRANEKRGTGQLQKLLDLWRGHSRPNAQPGFGLPEVFREFSRLLQRSVPIDQREATAIEAFYRKTGPCPLSLLQKLSIRPVMSLDPTVL